MRTLNLICGVVIFLGLLQSVACKKSSDLVSNESLTQTSSSDATVGGEFPDCKLRRIVHPYPYNPKTNMNGLFTYNSAGNPHSLIYTGEFSAWTYHFFYDKKNRLTEMRKFIETEAGGLGYYEMHRYTHGENDLIIADTVYYWRSDATSHDPYEIITIAYDSEGRIVKESWRRPFDAKPYRNPTYTYDLRGNLAVTGWKSSGYEKKVSIYRNHPVFKFLFRNYSQNNQSAQLAYNSKGLPTFMDKMNDSFFDAYQTGPLKLIYDCE